MYLLQLLAVKYDSITCNFWNKTGMLWLLETFKLEKASQLARFYLIFKIYFLPIFDKAEFNKQLLTLFLDACGLQQ